MSRGVGLSVVAFVLSIGAQARSAPPPSHVQADEACRESLEAEAAHSIGATTKEFPDYTATASSDRLTRYYFTKRNNKVYPWAVRAVFTVTPYKKGKDVESSITTCLPKDAAQPTPQQWQGAAGWATNVMKSAERELLKPASPK